MRKWLGRIIFSVPILAVLGIMAYAVGFWTVISALGLMLGTAAWMTIALKLMGSKESEMITEEQIEEMQAEPELRIWQMIQAYNDARDLLNDTRIVARYLPELEDMAMDLGNKLSQHLVDTSA